MKKTNKWLIISIFFTILSIIGTLFVYPTLPVTIPTHFNTQGIPDNFGSRSTVFITAILPLALLLTLVVVAKIDPKKDAYKKHNKAYSIFMFLITLFLIATHWVSIAFALGYPVPIQKVMPFALGILFIIMGNYMPQIRPNYTFGIKMPWTLNDENNWRATHRFGGYAFILAGVCSILSVFLPSNWSFIVTMGSLFIMLFATAIYSYRYEKKYGKHS